MPFDGRYFEQQDAVLDTLRQARERIARPGSWCQGFRCGRYCITYAIHEEAFAKRYARAAQAWAMFMEITTLLERQLPPGWLGRLLPEYNDAPGRTQAEIVALFDRAIAARESGSGIR